MVIKNCPALGQYDTCNNAEKTNIFCKNCNDCLLKKIYRSKDIKDIKGMFRI